METDGLTLAGHADWPIALLADAVAEGGAARLGGVLRVGAQQAGAQASRCPLWFIGGRRTCWREARRGQQRTAEGKYCGLRMIAH